MPQSIGPLTFVFTGTGNVSQVIFQGLIATDNLSLSLINSYVFGFINCFIIRVLKKSFENFHIFTSNRMN